MTTQTDTAEAHKAALRRFDDEAWNRKNLEIVDELFAPEHVFCNAGMPPLDREGHKQMMAMFQSAFPDGRATTTEMVAEGDRVATRWSYTGTHRGEFQGVPPTGKQVTLSGISIWRFQDGVIVESWHNADILGMMQQLGVIPASAPT